MRPPEVDLSRLTDNRQQRRSWGNVFHCLVRRCFLSLFSTWAEGSRAEASGQGEWEHWLEKVKRLELKRVKLYEHWWRSSSEDKAEVQCGGGSGFTGLVSQLACSTGGHKNSFVFCIVTVVTVFLKVSDKNRGSNIGCIQSKKGW